MTVQMTQRNVFFNELFDMAKADRSIVVVAADCGCPALDRWRSELPNQFLNVGIAEQNMISVAAGLSLEGKRVYCYAIAPFASLRCLEQIRVDISMMKLPVTIVAVGAGYSYDLSGATHHAVEDVAVMRAIPNMTVLNMSSNVLTRHYARKTPTGPRYIRLDREMLPEPYLPDADFHEGFSLLRNAGPVVIFATGYMVHKALEIANRLEPEGVKCVGVADVYQLSPPPPTLKFNFYREQKVVTIEEHFGVGGLSEIIAGEIRARGFAVEQKAFYLPQKYSFEYGGRAHLHKLAGLDTETAVADLLRWLKPEIE